MFKTHKSQAHELCVVCTSETPRRRHTHITDLPVTQGCKPWQGSITPLTINALNDVGQKTAGDGYRCQNNGKLRFDLKL